MFLILINQVYINFKKKSEYDEHRCRKYVQNVHAAKVYIKIIRMSVQITRMSVQITRMSVQIT
jgi:hypothetical protein